MATANRRLTLILGAMLLLAGVFFYQDPEWNGNSRLDLTRAVVEQGTLSIDSFHEAAGWSTGDKAYYNGHYYSDKAIGASLLAVPVHFLLVAFARALGVALPSETIKHVLTSTVMGFSFVLAGLSMYFVALRILRDPWRALLPTLAISLGTMLWPYSAVFYGHVPAAAFLVATFALLFCMKHPTASGYGWRWLCVGLAVSMAFLSDYTSAAAIPGLAAYALYVLRAADLRQKVRAAWPAILGVLPPLMVFFAYDMAIYGRPIAFGYAYEAEERFQEIMGLGLMGMRFPTLGAIYHITIDPKYGLLWLSPFLILSALGFWAAWTQREYLAESALSIYVILVVFYMNAASFLWYGGSTFGPRLLISAMPFFITPLTLLPRQFKWPFLVLSLISIVNMLIPLSGQIQYTRLEFKPDRGGFFVAGAPFDGFSLLYGYGLPKAVELAKSDSPPWTLGGILGMSLWISLLALAVTEAGLAYAFRRMLSGVPQMGSGPATSVHRSCPL